jgi:hypothetical protein
MLQTVVRAAKTYWHFLWVLGAIVVFRTLRWNVSIGGWWDFIYDIAEWAAVVGVAWVSLGRRIRVARPLYVSVYSSTEALLRQAGNKHSTVKFAINLLARRLNDFLERESGIINKGLVIGSRELERFATVAFSNCNGSYIGTDENVPSKFVVKYPGYLSAQIRNSHRKPSDIAKDIRILMVTEKELVDDYQSQRNAFRGFYDEHRRNHITLLRVDPELAKAVAQQRAVPSPAFGVFGADYAVFFEQKSDPTADRTIHVVPINDDNRANILSLLTMMIDQAELIVCGLAGVPRCEILSDADRADIQGRLPIS